jgi:hypothetical protein
VVRPGRRRGDEPLVPEEPEPALYQPDGRAQRGGQIDHDGAAGAGPEQRQNRQQFA